MTRITPAHCDALPAVVGANAVVAQPMAMHPRTKKNPSFNMLVIVLLSVFLLLFTRYVLGIDCYLFASTH